MDAAARVAALLVGLQAEIPGFSLRYKDESPSQRLVAALVWPFNRRYLQDYTTVLFGRVYLPSRRWRAAVGEAAIYEILSHEAVHLRDARCFPLVFELSYLLLPLPALLTAPAGWEWRGYRASMRARLELGLPVDDGWIEAVVQRFVGADYLYMWPFPAMLRRRLVALRAALRDEVAGDARGVPGLDR